MVHRLRIPITAVTIALASALLAAAPAQADQGEYLKSLQPKYVYLSAQQLLDEGARVCALKSQGVDSIDAIGVIVKDLSVSVATAADIVSTAVAKLDC
ncbi:MAG TPA: hypothetical protein VH496_14715 [Mycobacterium sp.]|jgi:hypothetical protein